MDIKKMTKITKLLKLQLKNNNRKYKNTNYGNYIFLNIKCLNDQLKLKEKIKQTFKKNYKNDKNNKITKTFT